MTAVVTALEAVTPAAGTESGKGRHLWWPWSARLVAVFDEGAEPGREPPGIDEVDEMPVPGHSSIWASGVARSLVADLAASTDEADPLVSLALTAPSQAEFLEVDTGLVRLLELAVPQAEGDSTKARLLARLAQELLGDSSAGPRRRALADEALKLARDCGEPQVLAEVLDARLHALWDPDGAEDRLVWALNAEIAFYRGTAEAPFTVDDLLSLARRLPRHLMEASNAAWLWLTGRTQDAQAEMDRSLPAVLAGSGPRQLGAAAMLSYVAALAGDASAAAHLRETLLPYRGRLVVFGGANTCMGPVSWFLGLLATRLGLLDEAVSCLDEATALAEKAGALPRLALGLQATAAVLSLRQAPGDRQRASGCRAGAREIAERLGVPGLLDRLTPTVGQWSLGRDGDDWLLQAGPERTRRRDSRGLHYLRALLAAPGSDISALDLAAGRPGLAPSDNGPLLDATARNTYRHRIRQLDDELAAADRTGDSIAAGQAYQERQALISELQRSTGLARRPRRASPDAERARVNVTRTLRATIDRITLAAPMAGAHLASSIRTGTVCRYQPASGGPDRWHT